MSLEWIDFVSAFAIGSITSSSSLSDFVEIIVIDLADFDPVDLVDFTSVECVDFALEDSIDIAAIDFVSLSSATCLSDVSDSWKTDSDTWLSGELFFDSSSFSDLELIDFSKE